MNTNYDIFKNDPKYSKTNPLPYTVSTTIPKYKTDSQYNDQEVVPRYKEKNEISEFDEGTNTNKNAKDNDVNILGKFTAKLNELNKIPLPQFDVNILGSRLSATNLIFRYLIDFFLLIPYFICKNFVVGCVQVYDLARNGEYKQMLISGILYSLDSLLPLSYIFLFFILVSIQNEVFYNWIANCFILFCVFLLLVVYYSLAAGSSESTFSELKDFFDLNHLDLLGLGMCKRTYDERKQITESNTSLSKSGIIKSLNKRQSIHQKLSANTKDYTEFQKSIKKIFEALNIDDTYFYYSYFNSDLDKKTTILSYDQDVNNLLASQMIFVHHRGDDLLFKINEYSILTQEKQHEFKCINILWIFLLFFFKIVAPYIYMYEEVSAQEINSFVVFSIILFYVYIMAVLFPLLSHEDLKRRTFILEQLNNLIQFQKDLLSDEDDTEGENSPQKNNNFDALNDLKLSGIGKITSDLQLKIDVTCVLSLQTWDSCRRAAVLMDQKKSEKFEFIYIFLGIYAFFILIVLVQVLFQVYIFFSKTSVLNSPLIVFIFTIDFSIMIILFFHRIYYGSNFNESFKKNSDSLDKLTHILQDLIDGFDIYYESKRPLNNVIYKAILDRILIKYETIRPMYDSYNRKEEGKIYLKNYIKKILDCINKIKNQISFDETHHQHRFLGVLPSDFNTLLSEFAIVMIPFSPTVLNSIYGNDD